MRSLVSIAVAAMFLTIVPSAFARFFGDPVSSLAKGGMEIGLNLTNMSSELDVHSSAQNCVPAPRCRQPVSESESSQWRHELVFWDYGMSAASMLRLELGHLATDIGDTDGTEFGASYRFHLGTRSGGPRPITIGGLVGLHSGMLSNGDLSGSYMEYEAAAGGSIAAAPGLDVYFAALVDSLYGSVSDSGNQPSASKVTFSNRDPIGLFGGLNYTVAPNFLIGGEFHLIHDTGWALMGLMRF